jgi:uncharacterized protein
MKIKCVFPFSLAVASLLNIATQAEELQDKFTPAAPGAVQIGGRLGEKMELSVKNRVMAQDLERIIQPFRDRTEENGGHWRCEYWGKWITSAAWAFEYEPTPEHRAMIDRGVSELLATQTPDGYIGTYKDGKHLEAWDVWGRKYVLLGLLADYDLSGNEAVLKAARREADFLIKEAPPGKVNLSDNGLEVVKGLPASSILEPMARLYQRTGEKRYLDFADSIISNWSKPGKFSDTGPQLIENGLSGTPPTQISSRKAYEMMSCFEGLCEMYRVTGNRKYLDAAVNFAKTLLRTEIMVHGSGSNQELWCDGARIQTETMEQPVETCVTATWMKLCDQLLRLTGDPVWADQLEISLYNALLGAMTPDGAWWAYFSPLSGQRVPSHYQHDDCQLSCCVANGPRGLFLTPRWAVMGCKSGVVVNLYSPGSATQKLADGTEVKLVQLTDYPVGDTVMITVSPQKKSKFTLNLRIPAWSKQTSLTVNGKTVAAKAGSYAELEREWVPGDQVVLKLDLRGRALPAPSGAPQFAIMRGPVLLALDNRLTKMQDLDVWLESDKDGYVALQPNPDHPADVWMAFDVPFDVRPSHYFNHHQVALKMCDYASAGNGWSSDDLFRVWLPRPLFLRNAYPSDTWHLMYPEIKDDHCPTIPKATSVVGANSQPRETTEDKQAKRGD